MANTNTLTQLLTVVRARLLTFVPSVPGGGTTTTLAARLGTATGAGSDGKLYITQAPDTVTHPYGVMRWVGGFVSGDDGGFQMRGPIELQLYHYGRKNEPTMNGMMDICEQAWRDYVALAVNDSIVAQRMYGRAVVPYEAPADRELVCVRALFPLYTTPLYQAQYSATLA